MNIKDREQQRKRAHRTTNLTPQSLYIPRPKATVCNGPEMLVGLSKHWIGLTIDVPLALR